MNKNNKKMYVAPRIEELVIELEQGIAAGSGAGFATPASTDTEDGDGGQDWDTNNF